MTNPIVQHDPVILKLIQAGTALAEASTIQQTKLILDVAAAAEIYAKRQQLSEENIGRAHSLKIDALRKLGELLKETPKATAFLGGSKKEPTRNDAPTLKELGLDKKTSSIAQKLAELPEAAFEQVRKGHETIAKAIAAVKGAKPVKISASKIPDPDPVAHESADLRDHIDEMTQSMQQLMDENKSMLAVFQADDKLAAALVEIKRLTEVNRILEERLRGLMNEVAAAKQAAVRHQKRADKCEKVAKI